MITHLAPSAERTVLTTRFDGPFFPNIRHLTLASRAFGRIIMTETVQHLSWYVDDRGTSAADLASTCGAIVKRMPKIKTLSLHFRDITLLTEPLVMLFSGLLGLEELSLPLYGLTPSLIQTLALLPSLREIRMTTNSRKSVHSFPPTINLQEFRRHEVHFPYGSFPELQGFSLSCPTISLAGELLSDTHFPLVSLTRLFVRIPHINGIDRERIRAVLNSLSLKATAMEDLTLWLTQSGRHTPPMMSTVECLRFADLISISNFTQLRSFTIVHPFTLNVTDDDLERLAPRLPRIQRLFLNHHPALTRPTDVTLRSLQTFAKFCPELQELGLFLNGMEVVEPGTNTIHFPPQFRKLFLGRSWLPGMKNALLVRSFARYLTRTFSSWVSILSPTADDTLDTREYLETRGGDAIVPYQSQAMRVADERLQYILAVARILREYRERLMRERDELCGRVDILRSRVYDDQDESWYVLRVVLSFLT